MGVVIAAWIASQNIMQDRREASIYIHPIKGEIQLLSKGSYFCPSYCQVQHTHQAHKGDYDCGCPECVHLIYDRKDYPSPQKVKVKKRKGSNGLPFKVPVTTH